MPVVGCFGISASCRTTARMALVPALQREMRALTASASTSTVATGDGGSAAGENTYNMSLDAPPSPLSSGQARSPCGPAPATRDVHSDPARLVGHEQILSLGTGAERHPASRRSRMPVDSVDLIGAIPFAA
jgi:hypothetical protein